MCSATNGYVVGVVQGYKHGGDTRKWRDFANVITIYDPLSNLFTQYVHLAHMSSFVNIGDTINKGDPIGLAGLTGFTKGEHLHFNTIIAVDSEDGFQSIPIEFTEGYKGKELKRNDVVIRD